VNGRNARLQCGLRDVCQLVLALEIR